MAYERAKAREIIDDDLKQEAIMWEKLPPAMAKSPEDAYLEGVRISQVYVGIIGAEPSPGSFAEYQEALEGGKKPLIFVKTVKVRDPKEEEFLERASVFKYADYSEPSQFPPKLRESLLALIAEQAAIQMQVTGEAHIQYVQSYRTEYIRPLFEETNTMFYVLRDRTFEILPTDAWTKLCQSIHFGTNERLDQEIQSTYKAAADFNDRRNLALDEFRRIAEAVLKAVVPINVEKTQHEQILERLVDHAPFFIIRRNQDDAWWKAYDNTSNDVDIPLRNINATTFAKTSTSIKASEIVDKVLATIRNTVMMSPIRGSRSYIGEYNKMFDQTLVQVASVCGRLRGIYSGKV